MFDAAPAFPAWRRRGATAVSSRVRQPLASSSTRLRGATCSEPEDDPDNADGANAR